MPNFCGLCRRIVQYDTVPSKIDFWRAEFFFRYVHDPIFTVHIGISSLASHFFGLILTFCTDLFSFFAPGTKATGREFVPQQKVKISPNSVEFSTD